MELRYIKCLKDDIIFNNAKYLIAFKTRYEMSEVYIKFIDEDKDLIKIKHVKTGEEEWLRLNEEIDSIYAIEEGFTEIINNSTDKMICD